MHDSARISQTADTSEPALEALLRDVLGIVSHDLRTPLSVIHTTASMLLNPKYQLSPAQVRQQHERIRRNVDLMNRMIGEVTDMVSVRRGSLQIDRQPVDLNEVLRDAVSANEVATRDKSIVLEYHPAIAALNADGDRARLLQMIQILIGNAIKRAKAGNCIQVTSRAESGAARIDIADNGPGIPPDDLAHIFDPYQPGGNRLQQGNAGIGLLIGKGIVEAHGGEIQCASIADSGTTFSITLPLRL